MPLTRLLVLPARLRRLLPLQILRRTPTVDIRLVSALRLRGGGAASVCVHGAVRGGVPWGGVRLRLQRRAQRGRVGGVRDLFHGDLGGRRQVTDGGVGDQAGGGAGWSAGCGCGSRGVGGRL